MRLSEERIEIIALAIADRLAEQELVDLTIDEDDLANLIGEVMIKDFQREDDIQREAVEWLEVNRKHLDAGSSAWRVELEQKRDQIAIQRGYRLP